MIKTHFYVKHQLYMYISLLVSITISISISNVDKSIICLKKYSEFSKIKITIYKAY